MVKYNALILFRFPSELQKYGATEGDFNFLKPIGYVMHKNSLSFKNCTLCPHCVYVFCIYLRTDSDLCHLQHKLIGFV